MTRELLHDLGFFGHYLHMHAGGRGGKQFVLTTLHKNSGQLTQRELLERANISPAALSEVVAKLECEGLITREPYKHDRRQLVIELTEEGRYCAERFCKERETFEHNAFACLTPEETQQLQHTLSRLKDHWKQLEKDKEEVSA